VNKSAVSAHNAIVTADRKQQVGSGERGDKIRTYRFQDNTVKDHQTGCNSTCDKVMGGNFSVLWN
jgi:peptide chain release factor 1